MKKILLLNILYVAGAMIFSSSTSAATQTCTIGTTNDASSIIQTCINSAQANDIVELPVGKYLVAHQIKIEKPLTLKTSGVDLTAPRCSNKINNCAELIAAPSFDGFPGILQIYQKRHHHRSSSDKWQQRRPRRFFFYSKLHFWKQWLGI